MAIQVSYNLLALVFGILGNIVGVMVYLAPMVTFYAIYYKRQSTKHYDVIPYSMALFNATLLLYYAFLKGHEALPLITINSFGAAMEVIYLILFYFSDSSRRTKITVAVLVIFFNNVAYFAILISTSFVSPIHKLKVVGWIYANFSFNVYAAPLMVMIKVIRTKSVKSIPMPLSICQTLSAIFWFFYGFFSLDYFIAAPNVIGFLVGVAQIILFLIYRNSGVDETESVESEIGEIIVLSTIDDEMLEMIEIAQNNINATVVELEPCQESLHSQNNIVITEDSDQIQCVEEPDEPTNFTFTRANSVARF